MREGEGMDWSHPSSKTSAVWPLGAVVLVFHILVWWLWQACPWLVILVILVYAGVCYTASLQPGPNFCGSRFLWPQQLPKANPDLGLALGYTSGLCPKMGKPPVLLSALGLLKLRFYPWEIVSEMAQLRIQIWDKGRWWKVDVMERGISITFLPWRSSLLFPLSFPVCSFPTGFWWGGFLCCSCLTCLWLWECTSSWEDVFLIVILWSPLIWVKRTLNSTC